MKYDYDKLISLFNLQQKEIKDVMAEADKALETLEFNRHLLERHIRITFRLQEIRTRLEVINSRIEEIKGDQRLAKLGIQIGNQLHIAPPINDSLETGSPLEEKVAIPENGKSNNFIKPATRPPHPTGSSQTQQLNISKQSQLVQLEIIELRNLQFKLQSQESHFEAELSAIEEQLTARGIGTVQG